MHFCRRILEQNDMCYIKLILGVILDIYGTIYYSPIIHKFHGNVNRFLPWRPWRQGRRKAACGKRFINARDQISAFCLSRLVQ